MRTNSNYVLLIAWIVLGQVTGCDDRHQDQYKSDSSIYLQQGCELDGQKWAGSSHLAINDATDCYEAVTTVMVAPSERGHPHVGYRLQGNRVVVRWDDKTMSYDPGVVLYFDQDWKLHELQENCHLPCTVQEDAVKAISSHFERIARKIQKQELSTETEVANQS